MIIPRLYAALLAEHLVKYRQMAFLSGPRQVGKTTTCRAFADAYVNWDDPDARELVLAGPRHLIGELGLDRLSAQTPVVLFDELHKFRGWKQFLKGLFDASAGRVRFLVTGSSRFSIYRRGGDSLMGRYFSYRMHPVSVAEIVTTGVPAPDGVVRPPQPIDEADCNALWTFGGYPEPFIKRGHRFSRRWQRLRFEQLVREDFRDLTQIQHIDQLEALARMLANRSGDPLVYSNIARQSRISVDTARRWVRTLSDLHFGFRVRPWFRNVPRSLRKEPKWYLRDWAVIDDAGRRAETFIACHLLKAVEGWTDMGLGEFELGYLHDKEKREVDFVIVRDGSPWVLIEAKYAQQRIGRALRYFQKQLGAPFAFQVVVSGEYVDADCFANPGPPLAVPARTLLSQLL